jgi:predicted DNA-binding WGR domain protein
LKEYLEFVGADSQRNTADSKKFWEVEVVGKKVFSRYGRIGSQGTKTVKEFPDKAAALAFAEKSLAEKIKKGYSKKKTKQSQGDKIIPKETKPLSLTFEYSIGFSWFQENEVPLTLQQKREQRASNFCREAIEKGVKPKVEILSKGKVVATLESSEVEYREDPLQYVWPWEEIAFVETTHIITGKSADRVLELFEQNEKEYDENIFQARVKIGSHIFTHHHVWKND